MTTDRIIAWCVPVAAILAAALVIAAGVRLAIETRRLARRARAIELPAVDLQGAAAALERIQDDLVATTTLLNRAQAALSQIDANLRELADSPPVRVLRSLLRGRARAHRETPES